MRVPEVVDLNSLKRLPDMLRRADLHKIHSELMKCLPSLSDIPALIKLRDELKMSLPSMNSLSSLSCWSILELLANCLPEQFSHINQREDGVMVSYLF